MKSAWSKVRSNKLDLLHLRREIYAQNKNRNVTEKNRIINVVNSEFASHCAVAALRFMCRSCFCT